MKYLRLLAWKEFLQIRADKLMVRLLIIPVLGQLFIIGYALTTEVKHTTLAVLDRSDTPESRSMIDVLKHNELYDFMGMLADEKEARASLDRGRIKIAIVIPPDFSVRLSQAQGTSVQLLADGQDANSSNIASGYLSASISGWVMHRLERDLASKGIALKEVIPVTVSTQVLFNPLLKSSWFMIPALVVLLVTIVTSLLTGFSIVKEKERGTFEQLMVTPVKPIHVVLGKALPFALIGLAEIGLFLILATLWFGIPFRGSVLTLFFFAILYMFSSLGIGILTSTIARSSQQVMFLIWFTLIFFILLSGLFVPVENMPAWVQKVTWINPVRYFMFIVREIFLKGSGFAELWPEGLHLLIIGFVVFGTALAAFRRKVG